MKDIEKAKEICGELCINCDKDCEHCINNWELHDLLEMAKWKQRQITEKAFQIYLKELRQFNNLLARLNPEYDNLIDVDKSYDDFKRKMKCEL